MMKNTYTFKKMATIALIMLFFSTTNAQIRLIKVNPATNVVTVKNFSTTTTVNVSGYYLCIFPIYLTLGSMTLQQGDLNLGPGQNVTVISTENLTTADGELGLYHTGGAGQFGISANMSDYIQWGSGGHTREIVAVGAGIWTTGTFINVTPPYNYNGNGFQNGVGFWDTSLGLDDLELNTQFVLSPNPTSAILNVTFGRHIQIGNIDIADMLGKKIFSKEIKNVNSEEIDVEKWSNGLYFMSIRTNRGLSTKRFLKK